MSTSSLPNGAGDDMKGIFQSEPSGPQQRPVVLKFGGTSVGKFAPEIAQICL